jgi:hypothetical protein
MLQCEHMDANAPPEQLPYRVTLFFGPETVEEQKGALHCVFNVKKRSWKAGIQVSVEVAKDQVTTLQDTLKLTDDLAQALASVAEAEQAEYVGRIPDLFVQAIAWCKLDLRLITGLPQENQRIGLYELAHELQQTAQARRAYVLSYILSELDLTP